MAAQFSIIHTRSVQVSVIILEAKDKDICHMGRLHIFAEQNDQSWKR